MKKTIFFLSLFVCLSSTIVQGQTTFPFLGEITGKNVNVRAGGSANFERIAQLQEGDKIVVVDQTYSWYKVKLPAGSDCYMSADYVRLLTSDIGSVIGHRVNIRAGNGINYSVIGQLTKGTKVRIQAVKDGWYKIEPIEGIYGWVSTDFARFKADSVPPPRYVALPSKSIYPRREDTARKTPETAAPASTRSETRDPPVHQPVDITGIIEPVRDSLTGSFTHKVIIDEYRSYFLKGPQPILDQFKSSKVKIEGDLRPNAAASDPSFIQVKKIEFIL